MRVEGPIGMGRMEGPFQKEVSQVQRLADDLFLPFRISPAELEGFLPPTADLMASLAQKADLRPGHLMALPTMEASLPPPFTPCFLVPPVRRRGLLRVLLPLSPFASYLLTA